MIQTIVFTIIVLSLLGWIRQVKGWDRLGRGVLAIISGAIGGALATVALYLVIR